MNEVLKKIDELEQDLLKRNCYFEGAEWIFNKVKEIILAEQKEPKGYHICNDTSNDRYYRNKGYKYCPHCGSLINQPQEGE